MSDLRVSFLAAAVFSSLSACSSIKTEREDIEARGQDKVHAAYAKQKQPNQFKRLNYTNEYYIPELTNEAKNRPTWWTQKIKGGIKSLTLKDTMDTYFAPKGIMVNYLDDINENDSAQLIKALPGATLGDIVKKISFMTGYSYKEESDMLSWSKYKVDRFKIDALSGTASTQYGSEKSRSTNSGGGFGSRMSQIESGFDTNEDYTVYKTDTGDIWNDISESIQVLKSEKGKVSVNQSTTSVLVKDFPRNISLIESYIDDLNVDLGTVIAADIEIITFSSTENEDRQVDWSIIKQGLSANGVVSLTTSFADMASDSAPTVLEYKRESGKYAGSSALLQVLDKNGVSYRVTRKRAISINNYPTSIVYGDDTAFAEEAGSNSTANVGTNQTLRLGKVRTGEQLHMLPSVNDENVFLTLSTSLNKLKDIRKIESGDSTVEGPEIGLDKMTTRLRIRDGDTMVLSNSISEEKSSGTNNGLQCVLFGCGVSGEKLKEERIILITPRVRRD
ncbi:hypothetical protein [Haliea sp.]|jgi:type IVB pilus formation R64 PilN family outer membrane protein|uniref:hypothetical protein n=1 Tax=Haliea sp. TaxID=1932666 RepID=UPI000C64113B|nr:hypothetical protein [Haliea sp.]MAD65703.1 hypothetical protein [Haliea sp.]|tara:strand:+ start:35623 stop:37134 length:1512 start_codon:yes stop_codon:yes gene_type:complete